MFMSALKRPLFAVIYLPFYRLQCAWQTHLLLPYSALLASASSLQFPADEPQKKSVSSDDLSTKIPAGLLDLDGLHVIEVNPVAVSLGIHPGSTTGLAVARAPSILLLKADSAVEKQFQATLRQVAYRFSPFLEITAPGICTLELRTKKKSHEVWLRDLLAQLRLLGFKAQAGVGKNPEVALQAAHMADPIREIADDYLQALPLQTLSPTPYLLEILESWGIHTLGALVQLPRDDIGHRLGLEGLSLWDRAAGRSKFVLRYEQPPQDFIEKIEFDHRLETLEALLFVLRRFLERLSLRIEANYLLIGELHLTLSLDNGEKLERTLKIPAPTRDVDVLFRICAQYLETVQTSAPVAAFQLEAFPRRSNQHQFDLFQGGLKDPNRFFQTLARLAALVGNDQVGVPNQKDTHQPDCFQLKLPDYVWSKSNVSKTFRIGPALRRYRPSLTAQVELQQGKPVKLRSGSLAGAIRESKGPWKLSGNWWDRTNWGTEEWDIALDNGGIYRISQTANRWEVVGEYD
jgi:protein ImuB